VFVLCVVLIVCAFTKLFVFVNRARVPRHYTKSDRLLLAIPRSEGLADQPHGIPGGRFGRVHRGIVDPPGERAGDHWRNPQGVFGGEETGDQTEAGIQEAERGGGERETWVY
jgi:hypothetical protein